MVCYITRLGRSSVFPRSSMPREIWLRKNQRLFAAFAILPIALIVVAATMLITIPAPTGYWAAGVTAGIAAVTLVVLAVRSRLPRMAFDKGHLEVFLSGGTPIRVPIQIVECFFLGQGPSLLPKTQGAA